MNRTLLVAAREYLENVRTKTFLVAVFMTPLLMGLSFLVPRLAEPKAPELKRLMVVDLTARLGPALAARLEARRAPDGKSPLYAAEVVTPAGADDAEARRRDLEARVLDGRLFAYLVLRPSALDRRTGAAPSEWWASNLFDQATLAHVTSDLQEAIAAGVTDVPDATKRLLTTPPALTARKVGASGRAETVAGTLMPFVFALLLFMTVVTMSQALVTSTIEEKSNRVVEVLLSSVSPGQLMTGKILGTCAVGLTLMSIWALGGLGGLALAGITVVTGGQLGVCVALYLLGFFFFASMMVAIGSVCNTLKEAQNLLAPVMAVVTISFMFVVAVMKEPNGSLARTLSLVPFCSPFLMMLRVGSTPPPPVHEVALSLGILAASAWLMTMAAGRVFRVGVLLYGKPPSLREILRWVRSSG